MHQRNRRPGGRGRPQSLEEKECDRRGKRGGKRKGGRRDLCRWVKAHSRRQGRAVKELCDCSGAHMGCCSLGCKIGSFAAKKKTRRLDVLKKSRDGRSLQSKRRGEAGGVSSSGGGARGPSAAGLTASWGGLASSAGFGASAAGLAGASAAGLAGASAAVGLPGTSAVGAVGLPGVAAVAASLGLEGGAFASGVSSRGSGLGVASAASGPAGATGGGGISSTGGGTSEGTGLMAPNDRGLVGGALVSRAPRVCCGICWAAVPLGLVPTTTFEIGSACWITRT